MPTRHISVREADVSSFKDLEDEVLHNNRNLQNKIKEGGSEPQRELDESNEIDVMCLYTPEAVCAHNGKKSNCNVENDDFIDIMDELCVLSIQETNTAFEHSGINSVVRLVYKGMIAGNDFVENQYMCDALHSIHLADGNYAHIQPLRDQYGADLVTILTDDLMYKQGDSDIEICGCGDIFNSSPEYAYSIVNRKCATGYFSVAHELGKCKKT